MRVVGGTVEGVVATVAVVVADWASEVVSDLWQPKPRSSVDWSRPPTQGKWHRAVCLVILLEEEALGWEGPLEGPATRMKIR